MTKPRRLWFGPSDGRAARNIWSLLSVSLFFFAAACGGGSPEGGQPGGAGGPGAMPAMPVEAVTLAEKPVDDFAEFVGVVRSQQSTTIQPQAEGILKRILVTSGQRVAVGTPMFEIDAASQEAAVASLESLRAAREADATYARQQADRAKNLLGVGAMSQQEFEQAQTLQKTAEAQLRAVQQQIDQQKNELAYYRVTAPTAGVVGDIPVRVGASVTKATELTTIDANSGFEVYINVPVQDASRLKNGLPVRLVDDAGQVIATERVHFVSPSVDDQTQSVLIKTPLTSRGERFRTSQFVRAHVIFGTAPGLTVPIVATNRINGQFFVYVAETAGGATVAKQRAVDLRGTVGNEYVVRGGLKAGEKLIVSGIQKIGDGAPVTIVPASAPGPGAAPGAKPAGAGGGR